MVMKVNELVESRVLAEYRDIVEAIRSDEGMRAGRRGDDQLRDPRLQGGSESWR